MGKLQMLRDVFCTENSFKNTFHSKGYFDITLKREHIKWFGSFSSLSFGGEAAISISIFVINSHSTMHDKRSVAVKQLSWRTFKLHVINCVFILIKNVTTYEKNHK